MEQDKKKKTKKGRVDFSDNYKNIELSDEDWRWIKNTGELSIDEHAVTIKYKSDKKRKE